MRGSVSDFNNNARNVQGGFGFTPLAQATLDADQDNQAGVPDKGLVFNHGSRLGISNALDFMTEWVATVRTYNRSSKIDQAKAQRGRNKFTTNTRGKVSCADCHSGTKWTSSNRDFKSLAREWPDPAFGRLATHPNFIKLPKLNLANKALRQRQC